MAIIFFIILLGINFFFSQRLTDLCLPIIGPGPAPIPINTKDVLHFIPDVVEHNVPTCGVMFECLAFDLNVYSWVSFFLFIVVSYLSACVVVYWRSSKKGYVMSKRMITFVCVIIVVLLILYFAPIFLMPVINPGGTY